jgi:SnoaL-like domain
MLAGIPDFCAEICRSVHDGDTTWTEWRWSGTRSDGQPFEMRGVTLFEVTSGQIAAGRLYLEDVQRDAAGIETCPAAGRGPSTDRTAQRPSRPPVEWPMRTGSSARTCPDEPRQSSQASRRRQMQSTARMPEDVTSAYGVEGASRTDAQTYPCQATIAERHRPPAAAARVSAVMHGNRVRPPPGGGRT